MRPQNNVKLTVEIEEALYRGVSSKLHHGQLSHIIRKILVELDVVMATDDGSHLIYQWLYQDKPLTLPGGSPCRTCKTSLEEQ